MVVPFSEEDFLTLGMGALIDIKVLARVSWANEY
jgi:hypothetical protein